jgi:uncharacterized protein
VRKEITALAVGEALISVLDDTGVPTKVEKVKILPPSAQVGPISQMERDAVMASTPLLGRYADVENSEEAVWRFRDRMREARGLARPAMETTEPWVPGSYAQFVPDFAPRAAPGPGKCYYLRRLLIWIPVLGSSLFAMRALI